MIREILDKYDDYILMGGYFTEKVLSGKVTILVTDNKGITSVIKISRKKGKNPLFIAEYNTLNYLEAKDIREIPRINFLKIHEGYHMLSITYIPGVSFANYIKEKNKKKLEYLEKSLGWLKKYQEKAGIEEKDGNWKKKFKDNLKKLNIKNNKVTFLMDDLKTNSSLCHNDFDPKNIFLENGEISGVTDWESAGNGSIYEDALYLCFRYSLQHLGDKNWVEAIKQGFLVQSETSKEIRFVLKKYYPELSLSDYLKFLLAALLKRANEEFIRVGEKNSKPLLAFKYLNNKLIETANK